MNADRAIAAVVEDLQARGFAADVERTFVLVGIDGLARIVSLTAGAAALELIGAGELAAAVRVPRCGWLRIVAIGDGRAIAAEVPMLPQARGDA